ncbi:MAG: hypothetical protein WDO12_09430 [Pseudomonadota bacterium]
MSTPPKWKRLLPTFIVGICVVSVGTGAIYFLRGFLSTAPQQQKKVVQEVRIIPAATSTAGGHAAAASTSSRREGERA